MAKSALKATGRNNASSSVIILMVVFGFPKLCGGNQLGHDGLSISARQLQGGNGLAGLALLFLVVEENHRPILGADVRALPVRGGWIVVFPKYFQQPLIRKLGRVIFHQNRFGMAGGVGTDFLITWGLLVVPAGIARGSVGDSV